MTTLDSLGKELIKQRKARGLSQEDIALRMSTTQSAIARLERKLLHGESVSTKSLNDYSRILGGAVQYEFKPVAPHPSIPNMANIIDQVDYTLSVEDMPLTPRERRNLERVGRGEISLDQLLAQYVQEARVVGQKRKK